MNNFVYEEEVLEPSFVHENQMEDIDKDVQLMAKCICFCDNVKQFPAKTAAIAVWWAF